MLIKEYRCMKLSKFKASVAGLAVFLLSGCSQSPMAALKSSTINSHYDGAYWSKERDAKSAIWQEALTYCRANPSQINCHPVMLSAFFGGSTTPLPGKPVAMPTFGSHV